MPKTAQGALEAAMTRYERREELPRDVKQLAPVLVSGESFALRELRVTAEGQEFRLLFVQVGEYHHVCLRLYAFEKKRQKTGKQAFDVARGRLASWLEIHKKA